MLTNKELAELVKPETLKPNPRLRRYLGINEVTHLTSLSQAQVYLAIKRGEFPPAVPITPRAVAWIEDEVVAWMDRREAMRGKFVSPLAESRRRGAATRARQLREGVNVRGSKAKAAMK
jgi:prophage regulatory protein